MSQPLDNPGRAHEPVESATLVAGDDDELKLLPEATGGPAIPREAIPPPKYGVQIIEPPPEPLRYSLRELLLLTAFAAALLAVLRIVGAALFAATSGVLAFLILVVISYLRPQRTAIHLAWWMLMGVYLLASLVAILKIM